MTIYICAHCGREEEETTSNVEMIAEYELKFGAFNPEDVAKVCDDCYQAMTAAYPPEEFRADMAERSHAIATDLSSVDADLVRAETERIIYDLFLKEVIVPFVKRLMRGQL